MLDNAIWSWVLSNEKIYLTTIEEFINTNSINVDAKLVLQNSIINKYLDSTRSDLLLAHKLGNIDVDVVASALAQSTMRITGPQYMKPGMGDGGACHPRDNIALRYMAQELNLGYDLFDAVMNAREIQAENLAKELVKHAKKHSYPIYIHGKAYKPEVPYLHGSYSILIGHYCEQLGHVPVYIDPETGDDFQPTEPGMFLMAHSAKTTYAYTNSLMMHNDKLYCEIPPNSVIVDPWRRIQSDDSEVIHYGNTRKQ